MAICRKQILINFLFHRTLGSRGTEGTSPFFWGVALGASVINAQPLEQVVAFILSGRVGLRIRRWKFKLRTWNHHVTTTSNVIRLVTLRIVEE